MATTTIYVNFYIGTLTAAAPWDDNEFDSGFGVGTLKADLLDDTSSTTGIGLDVTAAFTANSGGSNWAIAGAGGWPEAVYDAVWYWGATDAGLRLTGLTNGDTYVIEVAGHTISANRDSDFTVGVQTENYINSNTDTPNPPVTLSGTVSGTTLDIDMARTNLFGYINGLKITITSASGPTVTSPNSGTNNTNIQSTGTDLDTVTGSTLDTTIGGHSIALNITAQTTTTINEDFECGVNDASLGSPANGVPVVAQSLATGATPWVLNHTVSDGVDSNSLVFTLNPPATHQTVQAMIAETNQNAGEGFGDPAISATEDDEVWYCPNVVGSTNITLNDDLTITADSDDLITINALKWAPSTGEWSQVSYTRGASVQASFREFQGLTQIDTNGDIFSFASTDKALAEMPGSYFSNKYSSTSLKTGDVMLLTGTDGKKWVTLQVDGMTVTYTSENPFND